ncbi:DUF1036 domain-containing protein [Nostoc sp. DSM 114167]|jgi:uncharacterized membrane protein|uniref:DUF1036 domain-containing protein n=1 Tax=Nostoc sp. DSM 114167 TaxID=3439050 RepID=UPI004045D3B6
MKPAVIFLPILVVLPFLFATIKTAIAIPYRSGGKFSFSGIDIDLVTGQTQSIFMPPKDPSCYGDQSASQQRPSQQSYQFRFSNNCSRPVQVALGYRNLNNKWETRGWWQFAPGEKDNLFSKGNPILSNNRIFYFYAETIDNGNRLTWQSNTYMSVNGQSLGFREERDTKGKNNDFSVDCK